MANSRQEKIARYKEQKEQEKRIKVKNSVFFVWYCCIQFWGNCAKFLHKASYFWYLGSE